MNGKIIGLLAVVLGALTAMGIGLVTAQNSGVEVRVEARRLADGRIEFAVAQRVNGQWSERILPSSRYFPTSSEGRWLRSSPVTVGQHLSTLTPPSEPLTIRDWEHFEFENVNGRHYGYRVPSQDDEAALVMRCGGSGAVVYIITDEQLYGDTNDEVTVSTLPTHSDRTVWRWQRCTASDGTGTCTLLAPGDPSWSYTPVSGDVGGYLRAFVYYSDASGTWTRAATAFTGAVAN